jgi:hypothetical protein
MAECHLAPSGDGIEKMTFVDALRAQSDGLVAVHIDVLANRADKCNYRNPYIVHHLNREMGRKLEEGDRCSRMMSKNV